MNFNNYSHQYIIQFIEHFYHPKKSPVSFSSQSSSPPYKSGNHLMSVSEVLFFPDYYINRIIYYVAISVLSSFTQLAGRGSFRVAKSISSLFLLLLSSFPSFQVFASINKAVLYIHIQVFLWIYVFIFLR